MRFAFIDNIRWLMIILVLSMHSADTYSPFGNWYYTEHLSSGLPTLLYVLVIGPLTEYYVSRTWHAGFLRQGLVGPTRGRRSLPHDGPMWFCAAPLIFCAVYAAVRSLSAAGTRPTGAITLNDGNVVLLIACVAPAVGKFLLLTGLGVIANFIAAEYPFRRIPLLKRIL